jgi:hypothetical protein
MARTKVTIKLNSDGVRELLTSEGVQAECMRRAELMAAAARGRMPAPEGPPTPIPVVVKAARGRKRARALVVIDHPAGLGMEVKHRVLGSAVDAARG